MRCPGSVTERVRGETGRVEIVICPERLPDAGRKGWQIGEPLPFYLRSLYDVSYASARQFNVLWLEPQVPEWFPEGLCDVLSEHTSLAIIPSTCDPTSVEARLHKRTRFVLLQKKIQSPSLVREVGVGVWCRGRASQRIRAVRQCHCQV